MKHKIRFIRALGLFDSVMLGIGFIVGSGIYIMPIVAASQAGFLSIFAWIIAGVISILTALCFAENAAIVPKAGGLYSYAHIAFGDFWGYLTGYTFWLGYWITIAVEMWAIAWYLGFFMPAVPLLERLLVGFLAGGIFTYINFRGIKQGGKTEDILSVSKILLLLVFVAVGLFFIKTGNLFLPPVNQPVPQLGTLGLLLSSTVLVLWAYQGVEIITVPEEEIKNAKKVVPRAIMISVFFVMALYLLVTFVSMGSVNWHNFVTSKSPLPDIAKTFMGGPGGMLLALGGLIAILSSMNAIILGSARVSYAMARDKLFPKFFDYLHPKYKTPSNALFLHFIFAAVLALAIQSFEKLALIAVLFTLFPYFFSSVATIRLQRKHKPANLAGVLETEIIPIIAALASFGLLVFLFYSLAIVGVTLILGGLVLYLYLKRKKGIKTTK